MQLRGGSGVRTVIGAVLVSVLVFGATACGGSSGSDDADSGDATTTTLAGDTTAPTDDASTTAADGSTTAATPTTTALEGASTAQRTAPADGTGTALLTAVRIGRNEGFERIVFEFEGEAMPGYRVQWVDGPITADGSGEPVEVEGEGLLEIVLQPASGVDLSAADLRITYEGPDRISTDGQAELLTDLVRTGDFEAVLTWVAGATEEVPFRVITLQKPTRIAIDLAT